MIKKHDDYRDFRLKTGQPDFYINTIQPAHWDKESPWVLLNQVAMGGGDPDAGDQQEGENEPDFQAAARNVDAVLEQLRGGEPAAPVEAGPEPVFSRHLYTASAPLGEVKESGSRLRASARQEGSRLKPLLRPSLSSVPTAKHGTVGTPLKSLLKNIARTRGQSSDPGEGKDEWH